METKPGYCDTAKQIMDLLETYSSGEQAFILHLVLAEMQLTLLPIWTGPIGIRNHSNMVKARGWKQTSTV